MIRVVVLLVILGGAAIAFWAYSRQPAEQPGPAKPTIDAGKPQNAPPRVEEKYGVTTEGVGGG